MKFIKDELSKVAYCKPQWVSIRERNYIEKNAIHIATWLNRILDNTISLDDIDKGERALFLWAPDTNLGKTSLLNIFTNARPAGISEGYHFSSDGRWYVCY